MTPSEIRFAADGMLQSLATWLRLLGYDCISRPDQRTDERFWRCDRCNKTFWRGSHVTNSLARLRTWLRNGVCETRS
jgi:uncharacterized protein with PIN domain